MASSEPHDYGGKASTVNIVTNAMNQNLRIMFSCAPETMFFTMIDLIVSICKIESISRTKRI